MKKTALILALLMCAVSLFACGGPEAKDILDDNGKAVATGYYDGDKLLYEEKVDDRGDVSQKTTYDDDGNIEKVENFFLGEIKDETVYTYEEKEGNYSEKTTSYSAQGVKVSVTDRKYEGGKLMTETVKTELAGDKVSVDVSKFTYNDDGTVLEILTTDKDKVRETLTSENGDVIYALEISDTGSAVKTFYENKRISKIENYTADGKLLITITNEYDESGKIVKSQSFNKDNELKDYSVYVYDGENLLGIHKYYADGTIHSTIQYDETGKATIHNGMYVDLD
ncbi:MAG: hypothetical protein IJF69_06335 [Clostridia bacterium]|nr:hypothetical protein [Clostridia bacterium]